MEVIFLLSFGFLTGVYYKENRLDPVIHYDKVTKKQKEEYKTVEVKNPPTITKFTDVTNGCETEITQIYNSKASGKITTCKGRILEPGQKTRIIRVNR